MPTLVMPDFMAEMVAELSQLARESPHLNQRSGVSVRLTIANYETLAANAVRRALRNGEPEAVPRISRPPVPGGVHPGQGGDRDPRGGPRGGAAPTAGRPPPCSLVFRRRVHLDDPKAVVEAFTEELVVHAGDDLPAAAYAETLAALPALSAPVLALAGTEDPGVVASAVELILEGLHLTKRLNKEAAGSRATYRGRG